MSGRQLDGLPLWSAVLIALGAHAAVGAALASLQAPIAASTIRPGLTELELTGPSAGGSRSPAGAGAAVVKVKRDQGQPGRERAASPRRTGEVERRSDEGQGDRVAAAAIASVGAEDPAALDPPGAGTVETRAPAWAEAAPTGDVPVGAAPMGDAPMGDAPIGRGEGGGERAIGGAGAAASTAVPSATGSARGTGGAGSTIGSAAVAGSGTRAREAEALERIRAHRRYPALARRRGIEGSVVVSFVVGPDGAVTGLRVARGADPILDEAAREAVEAAVPLPPLPHRVEVRLDFRLEER